MKSPFRWAMIALFALVSVAGAQFSGPEAVNFQIKEFTWKNERGNLFQTITLDVPRVDTLGEMTLRAVVTDTIGDSTHTVFSITTSKVGYPNYTERDTFSVHQQLILPRKAGRANSRMPDSLIYGVLRNQTPKIGDELRVSFAPVDPDQGYFQPLFFANDTVKGTGTDTSEAVYLGRGAKAATFGFQSPTETAEVLYTVIYNIGEGWGPASPLDTLAAKTWTDNATQNVWQYRNYGDLLNATYMKVIRTGEAAADTARTWQSIRLNPR